MYINLCQHANKYTQIESSNKSLAFFQSRQQSRFIKEIRPNRLDAVKKHVISGINMKNRYKIVLLLCAKYFAFQKYVVF